MANWPTYQAAPQIDLPPWNWNPAATFLTAYNTMEQAKMERAKFENEQQITQILLPYKVKRAALDLEELKSQIKTNEAAMDIRRDELSYRNRALEEEMRSRNKPKAIWNPSTGGFEPTATDDYLPPLSQNSRDSGAGSVEPPLPGGPSADPNLPIDPDLVPPMRDDEDLPDVSSADNNPLTRFAQSDSGFNNPLAKIDDNAANVPIGEQYLGGENNLAAGKFDSSLKEAAPASGFDLSSLPDVRSQEEPSMSEDEKAIQEIQAERKAFEQNVYEMRRQGYDIRPDDLRAGYASLEQKAKAKLIPFIPQLGEAGLESFKALNSGDTPIETAYAAAKKYAKAAQKPAVNTAIPDTEEAINKFMQNLPQTYKDRDPSEWPSDTKAIYDGLLGRRNAAYSQAGIKIPTAWDKFTDTFGQESQLSQIEKSRTPQFEWNGQIRKADEIPAMREELTLTRENLLRNPELRNQTRVNRNSYTIIGKDDADTKRLTNMEFERQFKNLADYEPYEDKDGSVKYKDPSLVTAPKSKEESVGGGQEAPQVDVVAELEKELASVDPKSEKAKQIRIKLDEYRKGKDTYSYLTNTVFPAMGEGILKVVPPPSAWRKAGEEVLKGAKAIR